MSYASRRARRYAEALFALAEEAGRAAEVTAEIERVKLAFDAIPELPAVLAHRHIAADRKLELARLAFGGAAEGEEGPAPLSDLAFNFLRLLIENRRVELLPQCFAALQAMLDRRDGVVRATVTTAVPLLKAERDALEAKLGSLTGANRVELEAKVSRSIIAGVVIHVAGQVIDASVRTHLESLRESLRRVRVSEFDHEDFIALSALRPAAGGPAEG